MMKERKKENCRFWEQSQIEAREISYIVHIWKISTAKDNIVEFIHLQKLDWIKTFDWTFRY